MLLRPKRSTRPLEPTPCQKFGDNLKSTGYIQLPMNYILVIASIKLSFLVKLTYRIVYPVSRSRLRVDNKILRSIEDFLCGWLQKWRTVTIAKYEVILPAYNLRGEKILAL
jgi:hypothetical protein